MLINIIILLLLIPIIRNFVINCISRTWHIYILLVQYENLNLIKCLFFMCNYNIIKCTCIVVSKYYILTTIASMRSIPILYRMQDADISCCTYIIAKYWILSNFKLYTTEEQKQFYLFWLIIFIDVKS